MISLNFRQVLTPRFSGSLIPLVTFVFVLVFKCAAADDYEPAPLGEGLVTFEKQGRLLEVEVAASEEARSRGLMFRGDLEADKGMLFVFSDDQLRGVWMKNTLLPLDILFISSEGRVVSLLPHVSPCVNKDCDVYDSGLPARYMLEVNAGYAARWNIRQGDPVRVTIKQ